MLVKLGTLVSIFLFIQDALLLFLALGFPTVSQHLIAWLLPCTPLLWFVVWICYLSIHSVSLSGVVLYCSPVSAFLEVFINISRQGLSYVDEFAV